MNPKSLPRSDRRTKFKPIYISAMSQKNQTYYTLRQSHLSLLSLSPAKHRTTYQIPVKMSFSQHHKRLRAQYAQRPPNAPWMLNDLVEEIEHAPSEMSRSDRDEQIKPRSKKRTTIIGMRPSHLPPIPAMGPAPQDKKSSTASSASTHLSQLPQALSSSSLNAFYVPDHDIHHTLFDNLKAGVRRVYQAVTRLATCTSTIDELDNWYSETGTMMRTRSVGHAYGESISRQTAGYGTTRSTMRERR